jgi:hypothetical protein
MRGSGVEVPCGGVSVRLSDSFQCFERMQPGLLDQLGTGRQPRREFGSALLQLADPAPRGLAAGSGSFSASRLSRCHSVRCSDSTS